MVEPGSLWMGAPGKFRRYLSEEEKASILTYRTNYLGYKEQYLRETGPVSANGSTADHGAKRRSES